MRMRHIVICSLSGCTGFIHISHKRHDFIKEKNCLLNMITCVLFSSKTSSEKIIILRRVEWGMIKICIGLQKRYPLFLYDFNETWIFWQIFEKNSYIKFPENLSSGSWVVPRGQADGQTDSNDEAIRRFSQFCGKRLIKTDIIFAMCSIPSIVGEL